ncbi:CHAD domain-containing protein [Neoroseomonas oryzicola]|uniref:CHAD domain-containing protein n=1 Tax=Neoroseomonas oryzicola TaxID=535904 RepID=A0A9X9WGD5_9PROT|nr:CHAD domain-containing protein [Neoroseomonas oryzicola]NKE16296.1 CHAD domain-containing protein [Neoroseomonas oryzicola]
MISATSAGRAMRQPEGEAEPAAEPPSSDPDDRSPGALTLDFTLPVEAAERLARLPFLQACRTDRARPAAAEIVWLDTADGALAAAGLAVAAPKRGPRQLVRTLPGATAPWHPGMPPEAVRRLGAEEIPGEAGEGPLVAVAAFTGRRLAFRLALPDGAVGGVLLTGRLRSVAAEKPVARLSLTGAHPALLAAAQGIAAAVPLLPPLACLAEEGRALATGTEPRPHRLGPPDTSEAGSVEDAFLRATGHLLEVIRQQSARIRHGGGPEGVHQTRVALRRLRSVLRVFRAATDGAPLRALDTRFREVLSVLGPARDWDVFLGGIGRQVSEAFPDEKRIASLLRGAEGRRHAAYEAVLAMLGAPAWRMLLIDATGTFLARPWRDGATVEALAALDAPVEAFGRSILERRWSRLRRAGEDFEELSAEALHELRLDGKRLRYAAEVFAPLFGAKAGRRFLRRVAALQEGLGIANDAAVARGLAHSLVVPGQAGRLWAVGVIEGWCEARVAGHRGDAFAAWERLSGKDRFWTGN